MRLVPFIFCLIIVAACRNDNRIPSGILPQHKMEAVLYDIMKADQFLADFVIRGDSGLDKSTESLKLYEKVFALHHISKEEFIKSYSFYETHPALLKVIMDSISRSKTEAPTEMIRQPVLPDSGPVVPGKSADSLPRFRKKKALPLQ